MMDPRLPEEHDSLRRQRWFLRITFGICIAATAAASVALAPESMLAAVSLSLAFWLAYALLSVRLARLELGRAKTAAQQAYESGPSLDGETGLSNPRQFELDLRREIARSLRYGDRTTLAVFDIRIVGFTASRDMPTPPSPAAFIADTIRKSVRETDIVGRLDTTRFAVLMTESDHLGGEALISRVRTFLALEPFTRDRSGKGYYVRAWAGCVPWSPGLHDPALYLAEASTDMERTRPAYDSMQAAFTGQGTILESPESVINLQRGA
jgi:GGDEF domain-containing protein